MNTGSAILLRSKTSRIGKSRWCSRPFSTCTGKRVLIPSAAVTREVVPAALQKLGARVEVVEAYRNVIPAGAAELVKKIFRDPLPDWVTFASSSAVDNTVELAGLAPLQRMKIASIGPVTTETLRRHGLQPAVEANPHSIEGLVTAICSFR